MKAPLRVPIHSVEAMVHSIPGPWHAVNSLKADAGDLPERPAEAADAALALSKDMTGFGMIAAEWASDAKRGGFGRYDCSLLFQRQFRGSGHATVPRQGPTSPPRSF